MRNRLILIGASLLLLLAIPLTVWGQSQLIQLQGNQTADVECVGRRMAVTRISDTVVRLTCRPSDTPPTNTPVPPTATPQVPPTATPQIPPTATPPNTGYTDTFPEVGAAALGTCSAAIHDQYAVIGPDGNKYRTWHPIKDPSGCTFAHEHGDAPHPDAPKPPFGYISKVHGMVSMIAAHAGYKCFTHYANGNNGWGRPELDYGGLPIDFTTCVHQGTAGAGRLTQPHHDFWFWSKYKGQETLVTVMADTGAMARLDGPNVPGAGRFIATETSHVYEQWIFAAKVGNAWSSGVSNFAVTNPVTFLANGSDTELWGNCSSNFSPAERCPAGVMGTSDSFFLGNMRTIHEPDWSWTNANGPETFCTDPMGNVAACGAGTVQQKVAPVNLSNSSARILDRTANSQGFGQNQDILWSVGVPGGN